MGRKIEILDSTLRDGAQSENISYSVKDKLDTIRALDRAGMDIIEAGAPFAYPKDMELFAEASKLRLAHSKLAAFSSTCRKNARPEDDEAMRAVLKSGAETAVLVGKAIASHVEQVLGTTLEENLRMIADSVRYLTQKGIRVIFDAEHFFDGCDENPMYALDTLRAAAEAGADTVVLCDTNGGCFPDTAQKIVKEVARRGIGRIGIHCHNDTGLAVATSMAAVYAGANQVHGTFLGFGERCGNACLSTLIPNLQFKENYDAVPAECLRRFEAEARLIAEIANISLDRGLPYVGQSAFAHKAGMHTDSLIKLEGSYEHIDPSLVGNTRRLLISEMSGRSIVAEKLAKFGNYDKNSPEAAAVTGRIKLLEAEGYQFEAAQGSLELMIREELGLKREFFALTDLKIIEQQPVRTGKSAAAIIKVNVGGSEELSSAEGDGPVHAIDSALRSALAKFYPTLSSVHLNDFKVRVLTPEAATAAKVRVLINSTDGETEWSTVGVSTDIIEASWFALRDSMKYKLANDYDRGRL